MRFWVNCPLSGTAILCIFHVLSAMRWYCTKFNMHINKNGAGSILAFITQQGVGEGDCYYMPFAMNTITVF